MMKKKRIQRKKAKSVTIKTGGKKKESTVTQNNEVGEEFEWLKPDQIPRIYLSDKMEEGRLII